jgi:hypothetical protein
MRYLILHRLAKSELGWFAEFRRLGKETSRQRAVNFDTAVVEQILPTAVSTDHFRASLRYRGDGGHIREQEQTLKKQQKNWRLTGNKIEDKKFGYVEPGDLLVLNVESKRSGLVGSFDVISATSPYYSRILSTSDSSELSNSNMVAFHPDDANIVASLIYEYDRELFESLAFLATKLAGNDKMKVQQIYNRPPNPARTLNVIANIGHSLKVAVADLIDNSVDARATQIIIRFPPPDGQNGRHLAIIDNGIGMDQSELLEAMTIGSDRDYESSDLGKFGIGMKAASFSQARTLTVSTKKNGSEISVLRWDRKLIQESNTWDVIEPELETWEEELLIKPLSQYKSGTVVLWSDMVSPPVVRRTKRIKDTNAYGLELADLAIHLEMVFHRFLEGEARGYPKLKISLNSSILKPWDPFLSQHESTRTLDGFSVPLSSEDGKEFHVHIKPYVLPPKAALSDEEHLRAGHNNQWNKMQGFYVYRGDRLIHAGDWCGLWQLDEHVKLCRVAIEFDPVLDEAFDINVAKMEVKLPALLGSELDQKLKNARSMARSAYQPDKARRKKPKKKAKSSKDSPPSDNTGVLSSDTSKGSASLQGDLSAGSDGQLSLTLHGYALVLGDLGPDRLWETRKDLKGQSFVTLNSRFDIAKLLFNVPDGDPTGMDTIAYLLSMIDQNGAGSMEFQKTLIEKLK